MPSPTIPRASYRFQLKPPKCREAPEPPQKPLTWRALSTQAQASKDASWCATASDIAEKHVKSAFGGLKEALRGFRAEKMEKPQRSMPVILALAGTSANDHHATMCRARELLHQEVPKVCTALVRPRDFASLNAANRAIGEQLQGGDSSSQLQEAEADDDDECTAASSFVSCHSNSRCMTVLCIEAADAVPKQILKDVLAYWHENCMAAEIAIVAFLGLKRLKASRTELFDLGSEPGVFHHIQTVCLFDPEKVFHELLGRMKEVRCPLARTPAVQKSLRHIFQQFQQSVSHVLDMVCLLAAKDFNCSQESLTDAERHLVRKTEGSLRMLAAEEPHEGAAKDAGSPLRDTARIYQYLECSVGRQVKVADLWASCQKTMFASVADEVALPRFRQALATLHLMGIVFFVRGNAQKGVSGWHLKRRVFGRVWWYKEMSNFVKAGRSKISGCDVEASPCRSLSRSESMSSSMSTDKSPVSERFATPAKVPVSLEPGPGALLKRLPFPRVFDVEEGTFTTPQKKRARLQRIIHGPIDVN